MIQNFWMNAEHPTIIVGRHKLIRIKFPVRCRIRRSRRDGNSQGVSDHSVSFKGDLND